MERFNIKSIILGIGIGIILTSLIGWIYSAGENTPLTKEEIIQKAKEYGLVESKALTDEINKTTFKESGTHEILK